MGWCPTPLRPAISSDGLIARIYPKLGLLSSNQLIKLAELSIEYGNGELNLSNRAGLQIRGITKKRYPTFLEGLIRSQLVKPSQTFFNITTTPFWTGRQKYSGLFDNIEKLLSKLSDLPDKFGISIDIEKAPNLGETSADIRLEQTSDNKFIVRVDGSNSGLLVPLAEAPHLIYQISEWFLSSGGAISNRGRMKSHVSKGLKVPHFGRQKAASQKTSQIPKLGMTKNGIFVGLPFGEVSANTLLDIAKCVTNIRLTPWRMLLLESQDNITNLNLITNNNDPILKFSACVGKPRCSQANTDVRQLAKSIAYNKKNFVQVPDQLNTKNPLYHISGCSKGCANPKTANVTFVANDKNKYNIIYNGSTSDAPKFHNISEKKIVDNALDYLKVPHDP